MCSGSKNKLCPFDLKMEPKFQENNGGVGLKNCSKLLELAATDDLAGFINAVEEMGCDIDEASFWYGRSFGSKKMGFEERTPIMIASLYGSIEVLKYIIATGKVDVNRACGLDGATALHCAAAGGSWASVEVVEILIDASGDINVVDVGEKKPCDLIAPCVKSSSNSRRKTLEMLLKGFRVEASDDEPQEGSKMALGAKESVEKKEYPIDVPLPDINNGIYGSDEFRMYSFKVKPCSRAYSHDWTECPFVHPGENARRRDLTKFNYSCVPCPEFKKGSCLKGDACEYAHGVFESWLHPAQYKTRLCKEEMACARKVCFFAHKPEELRPVYPSTGSAMPSPKSGSVNPMDVTTLSSLSPSVTCSSPMGGSAWQNKMNLLTPPVLQLPGSRLKTTFSARDVDLEIEFLGLEQIRNQKQQRQQLVEEMASLEQIRTQKQQRQQLVEEMANLSSTYPRMGDLKPTNLDNVFGSHESMLLSQLQALPPNINNTSSGSQLLQSPSSHQIRQNTSQLRASYPSNFSSSSARKPSSFGFDSSAAVAAAMMNSRSAAFTKRSQSFIDRSYQSSHSGSANFVGQTPSKRLDWSSPDGKLDWGFNVDEANKFRRSASFGFRSNNTNASAALTPSYVDEPDVSWVGSLVKDVPSGTVGLHTSPQLNGGYHDTAPYWVDQMYMEQEPVVA
ncbi:zinc finger CCCH domain-containing protein 29-like isoform X1 [Primulina huaijiensis]|uniref:zinc finger CCCH domain-containing protein 29-like isoform X1 n=2 Tax=Primulina huaijiensis TaxID=1492673 RepID=UPI003CC6EBA9